MGSDPRRRDADGGFCACEDASGAEPFVRNERSKRDHQGFSLGQAFLCAAKGVGCALLSQRNFRIHLVVAVLVVVAGLVLQVGPASMAVLVVCIALVMAAECMNTAVEAVVDLVSPGYHDLARRAKDCAAGAVLLCAAGSVAAGLLVFVPALMERL
uniref:Diacylglycerol kinase family protein n=1 Tax=Muribaculaceae bacterium Z82 TaxID=2304548 RepID=A0A7C9JD72_9BACT